jgi:magnesium-transporting ATPase (P-type)
MEEAAGKAPQTNVKLVSGDHIETAKHVALACGIVSQSDVNQPGVCMSGDEF